MKKLRLAIIGQGRSGKDIHGAFLASEANSFFDVKYVVDADAGRRETALNMYPGCAVFEDYRSLLSLDDVDLVVNASFSEMHYPITKALLEHGKNVLCEKPFARNRYECEDLIRTAKANGALLTVFHQSLVSPMFDAVREIAASGKIGRPLVVNIRYNGFARRWDWQTLQKKMAGSLYNTGPHPLGLAMDLLGWENVQVAYSRLDCALTSGDAEDVAKIILTAPGKPVVDVEVDSNDAFCDYTVKVQGTRGTLKTTQTQAWLKYVVDGENPERPVIESSLSDADGNPMYCSEKLNVHEENFEIQGSVFTDATRKMYENLYDAITAGKPLLIDPAKIALLIGVIETVHAQNPLPMKY